MPLLMPAVVGNASRMTGGSGVELRNGDLNNQISTSVGANLTSGTTNHALPTSPTVLVNSTDFEAEWVRFIIHGIHQSATITDALLNIYIGGAGSEVLLIDSLTVGWTPTAAAAGLPISYWFPLRIPAGARISGSLRSIRPGGTDETCRVIFEYGVSNGTHWVGSGVETLGETTASSRGTAVTPATSAPGWATMGTSGRRYRYIAIGAQGNNDTTLLDGWLAWNIGTSSATIQNLRHLHSATSATEWHGYRDMGLWCDIPSGTSLEVRAWASAAPSGLIYATLHGVY